VRPECVEQFAALKERMKRGESDDRDLRKDIKELHAKIDAGFKEGLEAIATLKERSRTWGIIGGLMGSLGVTVVGAVILAAIL
jgi:hypothetical protein